MFEVWNRTDGLPAACEPFETIAEAQAFIDAFPKRFAVQGYYLTANRERIDPKDVELEIVPVSEEG